MGKTKKSKHESKKKAKKGKKRFPKNKHPIKDIQEKVPTGSGSVATDDLVDRPLTDDFDIEMEMEHPSYKNAYDEEYYDDDDHEFDDDDSGYF